MLSVSSRNMAIVAPRPMGVQGRKALPLSMKSTSAGATSRRHRFVRLSSLGPSLEHPFVARSVPDGRARSCGRSEVGRNEGAGVSKAQGASSTRVQGPLAQCPRRTRGRTRCRNRERHEGAWCENPASGALPTAKDPALVTTLAFVEWTVVAGRTVAMRPPLLRMSSSCSKSFSCSLLDKSLKSLPSP